MVEKEMVEKNSEQKTSVETKKKPKAKTKKSDKDLHEKIDELEGNLAELNDKYLRLFSEFDNYRKRTIKEKIELIKNASEDIIRDLLPVIDDFERALNSIEEFGITINTSEGIKLIFNKLMTILEKRGLKQMKSFGEEFNTDFHEAVTSIPAPSEDQKGKVIDVIEKGYLLNDKVIRFAKVVIGQ